MVYLPQPFHYSDDTPLLQDIMVTNFGYNGNADAGDNVINGPYTPSSNIDKYAIPLLQYMDRYHAYINDDLIHIKFIPSNYI